MADQLVVHYQPKIDLAAGQVCGVEALVRWDHPRHGLLMPDRFIPLAERGGMMNSLTATVLDLSLTQLRDWLGEGRDLDMAVNISARGLRNSEFVTIVEHLLRRHQIPGERLVLEITETTIAADPEGAREVLARLRNLGVRFSIDDFGTGYSSLAVLRSLPVSELKIDRSFISDLSHPEGLAIVDYSVQLGHMLGLAVVGGGRAAGGPDRTGSARVRYGAGLLVRPPNAGRDLSAWLDRGGVHAAPDASAGSTAAVLGTPG